LGVCRLGVSGNGGSGRETTEYAECMESKAARSARSVTHNEGNGLETEGWSVGAEVGVSRLRSELANGSG